jgi:hypothetical protein
MDVLKVNAKSTRIKLDKAQSSMMITVAIATVLTVFCLMGSKTLLSQAAYQHRVIAARSASIKQVKSNIANANSLATHYNEVFEGNSPANIIGGRNINSDQAQPPDGDNGTIVLHALPPSYDFPALLTSISKILSAHAFSDQSITGTDQSGDFKNDPVTNPAPTEIDLSVSGASTYDNAQQVIKDFERSIRPFDITKLSLSGNQGNMTVAFDLATYYQQAKTTALTSKEIK